MFVHSSSCRDLPDTEEPNEYVKTCQIEFGFGFDSGKTLMSRLHERLLGTSVGTQGASTDALDCCRQVQLLPTVSRALLGQLRGTGHWRGGLLFGSVVGETLQIRFAAPSSFALYEAPRSPLTFDTRYALGWIDGLSAACDFPVDWVGSWVSQADHRQAGLMEALSWMRAPYDGLFDDSRVLLCVGQHGKRLSSSAYRWSWTAELEQLEVLS